MNFAVLWRSLGQSRSRLALNFCLALALLGGLIALSYQNFQRQAAAADWVSHTYDVITELERVYNAVLATESAQRLFSATGNESYLPYYQQAGDNVPVQLGIARALLRDNPGQQQRFGDLERLIRERVELTHQRVEQRQKFGVQALTGEYFNGQGQRLMDAIRSGFDGMDAEEKRLLTQRREALVRVRVNSYRLQLLLGATSLGLLSMIFVQLVRQVRRANHAEQETRRSNAQLQVINAELKTFAYSIAHDLRSPLRAINGFSGALVEDHAQQLDEDARHLLSRIVHNGTRMAHLIDDLLMLSRVNSASFQPRKIDMAALVQEVCDELLDAGKDSRQVELQVNPKLPPATGDPSLVRQIWVNLLGNALKFTRGRNPARIEIGGDAAGAEFVTYFLRDNGAGFDMAYINKLFGPFQRLHRESEFEGTGIGLALVQRIVHRHGGAIWAEGKEGEGARFAFTLPEWKPG